MKSLQYCRKLDRLWRPGYLKWAQTEYTRILLWQTLMRKNNELFVQIILKDFEIVIRFAGRIKLEHPPIHRDVGDT